MFSRLTATVRKMTDFERMMVVVFLSLSIGPVIGMISLKLMDSSEALASFVK